MNELDELDLNPSLWSKLSVPGTFAVVFAILPAFAHFTINGQNYIAAIGGALAILFALLAIAWELVRAARGKPYRKGMGALAPLLALIGGLVHIIMSGFGAGALMNREDDVLAALEGDDMSHASVTSRSDDGLAYGFEARREWQRCTGTMRYYGAFSDNHSLDYFCGGGLPLAELEAECDADEAGACAAAAAQLRDAEPMDATRMTTFANRACELGEHPECFYVGVALEHGDRGMAQNHNLAFVNYVRACDARESVGCYNAAVMRNHGDGAERVHEEACQYYRRACDLDYVRGCGGLGQCLRGGEGVEADFEQARRLLERACEAELGVPCADLGRMYSLGQGVEVNHRMAYDYYGQSCRHEHTRGCRLAALSLLSGESEMPNRADGALQLQHLCDEGDRYSCFEIGLAHHEGGEIVAQDRERALHYFSAACALDHAASCNNQGVYVTNGWGGAARDEVAGRALYQRACDGGDEMACSNL